MERMKETTWTFALVLVSVLALSGSANATVYLSDNFDSDTTGVMALTGQFADTGQQWQDYPGGCQQDRGL